MDTAKDTPAEQHRMEKEDIEDLGTVTLSRGGHVIHCLTVIGQIEGHTEAPQGQKTTKYEHVIPQLVAVQEDPRIEGLLVLLNTVGGDVEAGLALAELIASISKPSATLVLGGGHSIGIPLAVSARHSFIVPTATMTVHPVRHSGLILGVPQTMHCFEQMQQRITGFVAAHSGMPEKRYTQLMLHTGELVMDMGTVLDGRRAVKEKLIDELGGLSDALAWLYGGKALRLPAGRFELRSAFALRRNSGKIIFYFAFVALCGALQTPFHERGWVRSIFLKKNNIMVCHFCPCVVQ